MLHNQTIDAIYIIVLWLSLVGIYICDGTYHSFLYSERLNVGYGIQLSINRKFFRLGVILRTCYNIWLHKYYALFCPILCNYSHLICLHLLVVGKAWSVR